MTVQVLNDVSLGFLRDLTPGSAGVFACCHCIVQLTPTGQLCKGIRDWFALPLSGRRAIHSPAPVQTAKRLQPDPHLLDRRIPQSHEDGSVLLSRRVFFAIVNIQGQLVLRGMR